MYTFSDGRVMRIGKQPKRQGVKQIAQKWKVMMVGDGGRRGRLIARWRRQNEQKKEKRRESEMQKDVGCKQSVFSPIRVISLCTNFPNGPAM